MFALDATWLRTTFDLASTSRGDNYVSYKVPAAVGAMPRIEATP